MLVSIFCVSNAGFSWVTAHVCDDVDDDDIYLRLNYVLSHVLMTRYVVPYRTLTRGNI